MRQRPEVQLGNRLLCLLLCLFRLLLNSVSPGTDTIVDATFTPDGSFLDYTVFTGQDQSGKVYQIPVLGGTPRLLLDQADTGVSFSPDGSQMTYALLDIQSGKVGVMIAKSDGGGARKLSEYQGSVASGGYIVRWSPDGRRIGAVVKSLDDPGGSTVGLLEVNAATGQTKPMPGRHWREILDSTWLPDGSGLLLAAMAKTGADPQLWIVSYPGGVDDATAMVANRRRSVEVLVERELPDIASVSIGKKKVPILGVVAAVNDPVIGSEGHPIIPVQPAGINVLGLIRIIGRANPQTAGKVQLHRRDGASIGRSCDREILAQIVRNTPDNYHTDFDGTNHLWRIDIGTGASSKLTDGAGELMPSCGMEGDWVFYWGQVAGGSSYIFKVPSSGGSSVRLSDLVSLSPGFASPDGRHVAFAAPGKNGSLEVAVVSAEKGTLESAVLSPPTFDMSVSSGCWMPDSRSLALVDLRSGAPNLWTLPLFGGPQTQLTHFPSGVIWNCAYSADGKSVALARGSRQSDAVLFTSAN